MTVNDYILLVIAFLQASFALVISTKNIQSAIVFKLIPFFSAVLLTLIAFKLI